MPSKKSMQDATNKEILPALEILVSTLVHEPTTTHEDSASVMAKSINSTDGCTPKTKS